MRLVLLRKVVPQELQSKPRAIKRMIDAARDGPQRRWNQIASYQRSCSLNALARRLLTTASNPFDIFSSQRLLERGEIFRMCALLISVARCTRRNPESVGSFSRS